MLSPYCVLGLEAKMCISLALTLVTTGLSLGLVDVMASAS